MSDTLPLPSPPAFVSAASVAPVRRAPTGRRILTPAKLGALDYLPPMQGGPTRGEILSAFRRALPALGIVQLPSVPMTMRHRLPGSLALRVLKDDLAHAHGPDPDRR